MRAIIFMRAIPYSSSSTEPNANHGQYLPYFLISENMKESELKNKFQVLNKKWKLYLSITHLFFKIFDWFL